ncbi:hypothetical protein ABIA27_000099 [Sinorhizobium fredii]
MMAPPKRLMKEDEIPAFVEAVIEAGCDICAVGHDMYLFGDAELTDSELEVALPKLALIEETYGDRDFLILEIVAYLRSLGRYLEIGSSAAHWSETRKLTN